MPIRFLGCRWVFDELSFGAPIKKGNWRFILPRSGMSQSTEVLHLLRCDVGHFFFMETWRIKIFEFKLPLSTRVLNRFAALVSNKLGHFSSRKVVDHILALFSNV